jgi:hypothetical protein
VTALVITDTRAPPSRSCATFCAPTRPAPITTHPSTTQVERQAEHHRSVAASTERRPARQLEPSDGADDEHRRDSTSMVAKSSQRSALHALALLVGPFDGGDGRRLVESALDQLRGDRGAALDPIRTRRG